MTATMILRFDWDDEPEFPNLNKGEHLALYSLRVLTDTIPAAVRHVAMELNVDDMCVRYYGPYHLLSIIDRDLNAGSGTPDVRTVQTPMVER